MEMMENLGAYLLNLISNVVAMLAQIVSEVWGVISAHPIAFVSLLALIVFVAWRVEKADAKVREILNESEEQN